MGGLARADKRDLERFIRKWENAFEKFPDARRDAVRTMGETVKRDLDANIRSADLRTDAKAAVISWQDFVTGSRGGYAAVAPGKGTASGRTWRGKVLSRRQVTRFLEKGHGVRLPGGRSMVWNRSGKSRIGQGGSWYVPGRMFYSWTKLRAQQHALAAAEALLKKIVGG